MSLADIWASALGPDTDARDASISVWLESMQSDDDVLAGEVELMARAFETYDTKTVTVALDTINAIIALQRARSTTEGDFLCKMYHSDLVCVAELVAEVFKLMEDRHSSDLGLRRAILPFQRCLDSRIVSLAARVDREGFHHGLICILQESYLACYQRRCPDFDTFCHAIAGARDAAATEGLHRSVPAHAAHLQHAVNAASAERLRLEATISDAQVFFHKAMQRQDIASALQHVLDMAPIADVMEPPLSCALQRAIAAMDVTSVGLIADIAQRHSLLRLPICVAPGPPEIDREPLRFVDGQVVFCDPPGDLEMMAHLGNQHPSVFDGEFEALAETDTWLDFEEQYGDSSNASPRFVPLAWLADTLLNALYHQSQHGLISLRNICCQAVQLLDSRIEHAKFEPEFLPHHILALCSELLRLAQQVEAGATDHNSESDPEQDEEEAEPEAAKLTVQIFEFSRHPQMLRQRLLACASLRPWVQALHARGMSVELPSGAKIFVQPDHHDAVLAAVHSSIDFDLKPWHVIACTQCAQLVQDIVRSLPSRQQVREKRSLLLACPPICDQCGSPDPRFACSNCHRDRYCSRECQRTAWQSHSRDCVVDEGGTLSITSRTFIEVDAPSSLRSRPSLGPKTVSTSQANPRVMRNPRKA